MSYSMPLTLYTMKCLNCYVAHYTFACFVASSQSHSRALAALLWTQAFLSSLQLLLVSTCLDRQTGFMQKYCYSASGNNILVEYSCLNFGIFN